MALKKEIRKDGFAIKLTVEENGQAIGRVYLYLIFNELHAEPYGLMEDLYVEQAARGRGVGTQLIKSATEEARARGCYKLIATSRQSRREVHNLYEKNGLKNYGVEFRMDFQKSL